MRPLPPSQKPCLWLSWCFLGLQEHPEGPELQQALCGKRGLRRCQARTRAEGCGC